ncbi:putative phage protein (TIGR02216 family) [Gellertiella hungarica]|uniref:Putative phage protein (TIGR02216 family) n=2 Tax=Gellertiella hungarica TaxID=1572859 RepID=A0A7W6NLA6_9HYPH|nr:putative phage protein (TIGR02216 family) [Gellertiella hungarica]
MHFGLGRLRLSPSDFWAMSPRELCAAAGPAREAAGPDRPALDALMARFPDRRGAGETDPIRRPRNDR